MKHTELRPDEATKELFRRLVEWQIELEQDINDPVSNMMIELIDWQLEQMLKNHFE